LKFCKIQIEHLRFTLAPWEQFCFGMMDLAKRPGWKPL
jgi:hypothetical protein